MRGHDGLGGQIDVLLLWRYFIIGLAGPAMIGLNYIFI
jgi:hypothetical protein